MTDNTKDITPRTDGYYWIRIGDEWRVSFFYISNLSGKGYWTLPGLRNRFEDSEFEEIDERKIKRP